MKPTANFKLVTPEMAKQMLMYNTNNRSINNDNLNAIIAEIQRKNFKITGESIKIAKNGVLLDGQPRLEAIIKTSTPMTLLVVEDLDNDVFKYIDTGRTRKASDVLAIEKINHPTAIAGMARMIMNFKRGHYSHAAQKKTTASSKRTKITNSDVSEFVQKNKTEIEDSYTYGHNKNNRIISPVFLSSFHFLFHEINPIEADDFCHKCATGENLSNNSPILLLRQKLLLDIRNKSRMKPLEKMALICKAWNLYRKNDTVKVLKWDSIKEPFPKPM